MATDHVNAVLAEIEVSAIDTPEALRARARQLTADWTAAAASIGRLGAEAAELEARALAIEARDAARQPVEDAQAAVDAALDAYTATAEPEAGAARQAVEARHLFEAARDELFQARQGGVEPAAEIDLDMQATSAAKVDERLAQVAAQARQERESAKRQLDAARTRLQRAKEELQRLEDCVNTPQQADIGLYATTQALFFAWPYRLVAAEKGFGPPLGKTEQDAVRLLAGLFADYADVIPEGAKRKVREIDAGKQAAATAAALNQMSIAMGDGRNVNVGQLLNLPAGMAGR